MSDDDWGVQILSTNWGNNVTAIFNKCNSNYIKKSLNDFVMSSVRQCKN